MINSYSFKSKIKAEIVDALDKSLLLFCFDISSAHLIILILRYKCHIRGRYHIISPLEVYIMHAQIFVYVKWNKTYTFGHVKQFVFKAKKDPNSL